MEVPSVFYERMCVCVSVCPTMCVCVGLYMEHVCVREHTCGQREESESRMEECTGEWRFQFESWVIIILGYFCQAVLEGLNP